MPKENRYKKYKGKISRRNIAVFALSICLIISITNNIKNQTNHHKEITKLQDTHEQMYSEMQNAHVKTNENLIKAYFYEAQRNELLHNRVKELATIPAVVTSYAPLDVNAIEGMCYSGDPNITASGTQSRVGVVAADWTELPVGTVLYIPGYGEAIVEDSGGAMRNYNEGIKIDVLHATRAESFEWGVRELMIEIIGIDQT